jgi:hypothetical protein
MRNGQEVHASSGAIVTREWVLADGAGGSAHGNVACIPARRGHAWLHVAGYGAPVTTVLVGFEERVRLEEGLFDLAAIPGRDPGGTEATLERFETHPWPTWCYRCGDLTLERSLFAVHGHPALVVSYRHLGGPTAHLRSSPLVVARTPSSVQRENPEIQGLAQGIPGRVRVDTIPGGPSLTLWHQGSFLPNRLWRRGIGHLDEPHKSHEDALVPGHMECDLRPGETVHIVASTEEGLFKALAIEGRLGTPPPNTLAACVDALAKGERGRRDLEGELAIRGADFTARQAAAAHGDGAMARRPTPLIEPTDPWTPTLAWAALQGLAHQVGRLTMLDPLPDAIDGGVSGLRALPGLVSIRAFEPARDVLQGFAVHLFDGLAPSAFDGEGRPIYDQAEPSLWMIHVAELLSRRSEEADWLRELYPQLESVLDYYRGGTRGGIKVAPDGLLQVNGKGIKSAALNALWYHALVAMAQLARLMERKENAAFYLAWARQHGQCFNETFWDEEIGGLHDAVSEKGPKSGVAPAHLLAVSLSPSILPLERARRLVTHVERELFTPLGLRPEPRAACVEPSWLGTFHGAYLKAHGRDAESQSRVRGWLDQLRLKLDDSTAGHVPAAFDWPGPRRGSRRTDDLFALHEALPRGASPLAAAELLRVWIEELAHAVEPVGAT